MQPREGLRCVLVVSLLVGGCSGARDGEAGREAWLQSTLVADNYLLALRDAAGVAGKLAKMSSGPYAFLRGTPLQYWRDASEPGGAIFEATRYGSAASARVVILGDPHLENVGSYRAGDGTLLVDFNDFDIATQGPYQLDVRRLAASFGVALATVPSVDAAGRRGVIEQVGRGYAEEIVGLAEGRSPIAVRAQAGFGVIVDDLLRRAARDGVAREELDDYTRVVAGQRRLFYGEVEASSDPRYVADRVDPVTLGEEKELRALLASYAQHVAPSAQVIATSAVLGVGRRLGAGVSSYPLRRYYVLLAGESAALDDDVLVEVKEILDPLALPALPQYPAAWFADTGERAVYYQRQLQEREDDDPLLAWATSAPSAFRVQARTKYQKGIDQARIADKLAAGDWTLADVGELAHVCGRLLARGHALARRRDGRRGLEAIVAALAGDVEGFSRETADVAERYVTVVLADYQILLRLLDERGPLLGLK